MVPSAFRQCCDLDNITSNSQLNNLLILRLSETDYRIAQRLLPSNLNLDTILHATFVERLREHFEPRNREYTILDEFNNAKQGSLSVRQFIDKLLELAEGAGMAPELLDSRLHERLLFGISKKIFGSGFWRSIPVVT